MTSLSKTKVQDAAAAKDLAQLTRNILTANLVQVKIFSEEKATIKAVAKLDRGEAPDQNIILAELYQNVKVKFKHMGEGCFWVFVTDSKGNGLTGVNRVMLP